MASGTAQDTPPTVRGTRTPEAAYWAERPPAGRVTERPRRPQRWKVAVSLFVGSRSTTKVDASDMGEFRPGRVRRKVPLTRPYRYGVTGTVVPGLAAWRCFVCRLGCSCHRCESAWLRPLSSTTGQTASAIRAAIRSSSSRLGLELLHDWITPSPT